MHRWMAAAVLGALVLVWTGVSARQDVRPLPGPGSGVVKVEGTVDIGNSPEVRALQNGEWRVAVANAPGVRVLDSVAIASPAFLREGRQYRIVWNAVESETITVAGAGQNGWIPVDSRESGRRRWINPAAARSVEEVR